MNANERADSIIQDILDNHLPRVVEGLKAGYVDENQVLVIYDHAVRARILKEFAEAQPALEHVDNLAKVNRELEAEWRAEMQEARDIPHSFVHPGEKEQDRLAMHGKTGSPTTVCGQKVPRPLKDEMEQALAVVKGTHPLTGDSYYVVGIDKGHSPDKSKAWVQTLGSAKALVEALTGVYGGDIKFEVEVVSDLGWKPHTDQIECVCGGLVKELPTSVEAMLKCEQCERVYLDEDEVIAARKTEKMGATKCADATYWTTGSLVNGTTPVPMEMQINLNGRKTTIKAKGGKFTLTYEEIVRLAVNARRGPLNAFTGSDAELPHETVVYHHRVSWEKLHGERDGSLYKGKSVECTPGMCIDCCNTGNA